MSFLDLLSAAFITLLIMCAFLILRLFKLKLSTNLAQNEKDNLNLNLTNLREEKDKISNELKQVNAENTELKTKISALLALLEQN